MWIFLFLICAAAAFISTGCKKHQEAESGAIPEIEVAQPLKQSVVLYETYPAMMESQSEADVVARVNGQLTGKYFQEGAYVSKGQLLFTIEPTLYSAALKEAQAQHQSAVGQQQYAEKHLAALEEGLKADAVSEMDVIQARSALAEARASVSQTAAAVNAASTRLGYCRVVAPISGKISAATIDVGAYVSGENAPQTLATIYNDADLAVQFTIPEYVFASISNTGNGFSDTVYRNVPLVVSTSNPAGEGGGEIRYDADVVYQSPAVDSSTGSVTLKAKVKDGADKLRSGMYAKVMLPTGKVSDGLLVQDASISTDQRGKYLYTINDSDKIEYTAIKIGELYQDTLRLVLSGLKPGQRYVTKAMISVRAGEKIKPVMKSAAASKSASAQEAKATRKTVTKK